MTRRIALAAAILLVIIAARVGTSVVKSTPSEPEAGAPSIDHLIFIVQENRSFDHYFGTYPGVDGLRKDAKGRWKPCLPNPFLGRCSRPYHETSLLQAGGPHDHRRSLIDVDDGRMDGFIRALSPADTRCWVTPSLPGCEKELGPDGQPDVMSFHTRAEIPNYWSYADDFVLQDHLFAPADSWTLPSHLFLVSAWAARCTDPNDGMSCTSDLVLDDERDIGRYGEDPTYAWTDLTYLLHEAGVSWGYYVDDSTCLDPPCPGDVPGVGTGAGKNPLPGFTTVHDNGQLGNVQYHRDLFEELDEGTLPSVTWVVPGDNYSEHPGPWGPLSHGQAFVTKLVNAVGRSSAWGSSAIFITWDDWGGFYDHVNPPRVDENGYGIRVPGLMISPYAKRGYIDSQTLSFDAYIKMIEDLFLGGQRLDPATDGRPDSRPGVREDEPILGDLMSEFDFTQVPRDPPILDPTP